MPQDNHFGPFLDGLSDDWYADDPVLQRLLAVYAPGADRSRLARWGGTVAGPLRHLAEESALPENAPRLRHRDAHDRWVDDVILPASTREALSRVLGDAGLGTVRGDPFIHYAMVYLLAQNGEAGVTCSVACTDGLARVLDTLGDHDIHRRALLEVRGSTPEAYAHGAQFVTEIQGGSDVPANLVRAVPDGPAFRLYGQKWFCSNVNADWFLVTARPDASNRPAGHIGLFLVPAFTDAHRRNGYAIERLKDKVGTRELATAEVSFDGARAWPVGPTERGLPHLMRYVINPSRVACVIFAAAALRQAERIAGTYARFRHAFGQPIANYTLVAQVLDRIAAARASALAWVFELVRLWGDADAAGYRGEDAGHFRVLLSLAKPVWTRQATDLLREAILVLGGNGIEERFSPLPRLYRDSLIMETWEGAHNVLFTQALNDFLRFGLDPTTFAARVTGAGDPATGLMAAELDAAMSDARHGRDGTVRIAELAPRLLAARSAG